MLCSIGSYGLFHDRNDGLLCGSLAVRKRTLGNAVAQGINKVANKLDMDPIIKQESCLRIDLIDTVALVAGIALILLGTKLLNGTLGNLTLFSFTQGGIVTVVGGALTVFALGRILSSQFRGFLEEKFSL